MVAEARCSHIPQEMVEFQADQNLNSDTGTEFQRNAQICVAAETGYQSVMDLPMVPGGEFDEIGYPDQLNPTPGMVQSAQVQANSEPLPEYTSDDDTQPEYSNGNTFYQLGLQNQVSFIQPFPQDTNSNCGQNYSEAVSEAQ